MSLKRKLEGEVEIRAAAGDVYFDLYKNRPHHLSHSSPHFIQTCELLQGQFGKPGSIILWRYNLGGKPRIGKCVIEEVNEEKKLMKHRNVEGNLKEEYKTLSGTFQVIPTDNNETCIVKWTYEYEKLHDGVVEPTALLDACLHSAKQVDVHYNH
ncbi:MLP-like protein 31 [Amaranthus tricolor]|uniref:MLP-like protein 31 n=1 Tax=Amaranthus tricolor TaxID=29722 RepID=UPI00258E4461|nr:MLP-like protein 31 [Amaranthus tricolor]